MSRSDPPVSPPTALVIDDDLALRGLFTTLLSLRGFNVDCACDGSAAFDQIHRNAYSVILLDLMMPKVNGFELLERLNRDSPSLLRRVIVLAGASQRSIEHLDTSRIWGMIRKPFDIEHLISSAQLSVVGGQ